MTDKIWTDGTTSTDGLQFLLQNRTNWEDIIDAMPGAFFVLEARETADIEHPVEFLFRFVNRRFEILSGLMRSDIINHALNRINPNWQPFHTELLLYVLSSEDSTTIVDDILFPGKHVKITIFRPAPALIACLLEDITSLCIAESEVLRRQVMEKELANISTRLILCTRENVNDIVQDALEQVGLFYRADRCYVFTTDKRRKWMSNTHEWCAFGVEPQIGNLQDLPIDAFAWWMTHLETQGEILIDKVDLLPVEAAMERETLQAQGIQTVAVSALLSGDQVTGFLGIDFLEPTTLFKQSDMALLRSMATAFSNAFVRLEMEKTLQERHEQLMQSRKLESIGRLVGGVAHDFNNMLSVILGYSDLILERMADPDPNRPDMREIHNAASRSRQLVGQLLAFARQQVAEPRVLNLNNLIHESRNLLAKLSGENVELILQLDAELWDVSMDSTQFNQILINLIVNARDAIAEQGHVEIKTMNIEITPKSTRNPRLEPGKYVQVSVIDDGCGMDQETLAQLFEPFFTTKPAGIGTGLGLATVYGIIHQHHGHILVESYPGAGSRFHLFFPKATGNLSSSTQNVPGIRGSRGHEVVLIVEDEESLLRLATSVLTRSGYHVLSTNSPEDAIRIAAENPTLDLLVTDVIMPGMNGKQLWESLCRYRPDLPCLFMSGYTADIIGKEYILEEEFHFLQKPFRATNLLLKVREVLDQITSSE